MRSTADRSLFGLFAELKDETKTLIKEELKLAKTEISEKVSRIGRNTASLAVGAFVAYAGIIVFLAGLASLLAYAFERLELSPPMASFLGLAIIGVLAGIIGFAFIAEAIKSFSRESVAPEKTLETLRDLTPGQPKIHPAKDESLKEKSELHRSSDEIQASVVETENVMGETISEISERLTPHYASAQFKRKFQAHPYRWNLIAMGTGLIGGLWVQRRRAHARA